MSSQHRAFGQWPLFATGLCLLLLCACSHGKRHKRCNDAGTCRDDETCVSAACEDDTDTVDEGDAQAADSELDDEEGAVTPPDAASTFADALPWAPDSAESSAPDSAESSAPDSAGSSAPDSAGSSVPDSAGIHDAQMQGVSPFKGSWLGKTSSNLEIGFTVSADGTIDSLILFVNLRVGTAICTAPAFASARASISGGAFEVPLRFPIGSSTGSISGMFAADAQSASGSYARIESSSILCGNTLAIGAGLVVASGTFTAQRGLLRCKFANDGVCDEPEGSGVCLQGADPLDCDPACADGSCDAGAPARPLLDAGVPTFSFDASVLAPFFDGGLPPFFFDGSLSLPNLDASLLNPWADAASPFTFGDGGVLVALADGSVWIPFVSTN